MSIVDRRSNPGSKSLPNRQRFIRRAEVQVREAVADSIARRKVADVGSGAERVRVKGNGTSEPFLHHGKGGDADHVLPGNVDHLRGDRINRPRDGQGRGGGGADSGDGEDAFEFTLTRDEFLDLFFQDLELPDLIKAELLDEASTKPRRAGFSTTGTASSLNLQRTMRQSVGRRLSLGRTGGTEMATLVEAVRIAVEEGDQDRIAAAREALEQGLLKASRVPWIDPIDLRYNRFEPQPKPTTGAVMFCLMDVSGSMSDHQKDLAKRFFMLLHLFLERRYERVTVVFIRHTHEAHEVDEDTFFRSRQTGGTVVSTALEVLLRIQRARFPLSAWNIYVAQASDGDNSYTDTPTTLALLAEQVLPIVQYFAYVETQSMRSERASDLWNAYVTLGDTGPAARLAMRRVAAPGEIWGVFADLFSRDRKLAA